MVTFNKLLGMFLMALGFIIIFVQFGELIFKIGTFIFALVCIHYGMRLQGSYSSAWIMRSWSNRNSW